MNYTNSLSYDQHGRKRKTKALSTKRKVQPEFKPLKAPKTFAQQQIDDHREKYPSAPLTSTYSPCLLYTSPSPRDGLLSRMPSSA